MQKYDVAAYVWPAYTGDEECTRRFWEQGMGEWQTVKNPTPKEQWKFNNPQPLWGYVNEADPVVMEKEIEEAANHGVNVFIYDWYWYNGKPFLEKCLNNGYLKAKNNHKVKFYLMWANHDVTNLWDKRKSHIDEIIFSGQVNATQFDEITTRIIEKYFKHPSYYKIDDKPVFMIYDVMNFIMGLGGVNEAQKAICGFRQKAKNAGFSDIELQLCAWSENAVNLGGIDKTRKGSTKDIATLLGFDNLTNYQFVHLTNIDRDYNEVMEDIEKEWLRIDNDYTIPYYPHISIGWDNNLRFVDFKDGIMKNNTPENFKKALLKAKKYLDRHPNRPPLVTINSWNEWTEGSYLQPDTIHGYGYLNAIKEVFLNYENKKRDE